MRWHPSARARRLSRRDTAFVGAPAALRRCTQPLGERERSGEGYAHRDRMRGNGMCDSSARSRRSRAMEESRRGGDPRRAAWMHGREIPVNLDDACAFDGYEARARVEPCCASATGPRRARPGASVSLGRCRVALSVENQCTMANANIFESNKFTEVKAVKARARFYHCFFWLSPVSFSLLKKIMDRMPRVRNPRLPPLRMAQHDTCIAAAVHRAHIVP